MRNSLFVFLFLSTVTAKSFADSPGAKLQLSQLHLAYAAVISFDPTLGLQVHAKSENRSVLMGEAAVTYQKLANQSACKKFYSCPVVDSLEVDGFATFAILVADIGSEAIGLFVFDADGNFLDSANKFRGEDLNWSH